MRLALGAQALDQRRLGRVFAAHPSPMKSRTSTRAPGRSAVSLNVAPARFCQAPGTGSGRRRRRLGVDLEVQVRRGGLGVAGVADVAEDGARLDVAAVDRGGREGREVGVEELVAAVGVDPEPVAGDRQRADVGEHAVGGRDDRRAEVGEEVVALVRRGGAERVERAADLRRGRRPGRRSACASGGSCSRRGGLARLGACGRLGRGRRARLGGGRRGGRRRFGRCAARALAETSATTILVPAGAPATSSVSVTRRVRRRRSWRRPCPPSKL